MRGNRWFGEPWPSPNYRAAVCEDDKLRIPTPVGSQCLWCEELIDEDDRGTAMAGMDGGHAKVFYAHNECTIRNIMGCSAYLRGEGHDHSGSYREDARRVVAWLQEHAA